MATTNTVITPNYTTTWDSPNTSLSTAVIAIVTTTVVGVVGIAIETARILNGVR